MQTMSFFGAKFAGMAVSFGGKLVEKIQEAAAKMEEGKEEYLKQRIEKDGGDFRESSMRSSVGNSEKVSVLFSALNSDKVSAGGSDVGSIGGFVGAVPDANIAQEPSVSRSKTGVSQPNGTDWWNGLGSELREKIVDLSGDERNVVVGPPDGTLYEFEMDAYVDKARVALEQDARLLELWGRMVPLRTKEREFFRNYFYRVWMLQQEEQSAEAVQKLPQLSHEEEQPFNLPENLDHQNAIFGQEHAILDPQHSLLVQEHDLHLDQPTSTDLAHDIDHDDLQQEILRALES